MTAPNAIKTHRAPKRITELEPGDRIAIEGEPDRIVVEVYTAKRVGRDGREFIDYRVVWFNGDRRSATTTFPAVDHGTYTIVRKLGHSPDGERAGCRCGEHD